MHSLILCISSQELWLLCIYMQFLSFVLVEIVMDELNLVKFGLGGPAPGQL